MSLLIIQDWYGKNSGDRQWCWWVMSITLSTTFKSAPHIDWSLEFCGGLNSSFVARTIEIKWKNSACKIKNLFMLREQIKKLLLLFRRCLILFAEIPYPQFQLDIYSFLVKNTFSFNVINKPFSLIHQKCSQTNKMEINNY